VRRIAPLFAVALVLAFPAAALAAGPKDQIVLTGSVNVGPAQTVRTVVVFDGPVTIRGHVTQDVVATNGDVRILGGRVDGDVTATSGGIFVGPRSVVGGDINWRGDQPVIAPGARVLGSTDEFNYDASPFSGFAFTLLFWIAETVSTLVLGIILVALWPRAFEASVAAWRTSPGPVLGWGVLLLILLPVAAIVALFTLVGIPLGIGLLLALIPIWVVGYIAGAYLVGRLIAKNASPVVAFLLGGAIVQVLALIPFVNVLIAIVVTWVGLGMLIVAAWRANRPRAAAPPPAPA
jgi:hypothetical protein